jgi:hypothetical protein
MSEIVTSFKSDDKEIMAAFSKQQQEIEKLRKAWVAAKDSAKQANDETKEGAKYLGDQVASVKGLVTGLFTVDKLIQGVTAAYSDWADDVKDLADKHKTFEENLIRTITKAGQLRNAATIEQSLGGITGATRDQGAAAYGGVAGAAPNMGLGRQLAIAKAIAPYGATGADLGEFGTVAGKVAELAPGKSAGDVADLVASLQQQTGSDFGSFADAGTMRAVQSLLASGAVKSPEEALGLGVSAHGANLKPGILTEIARATTEPIDQSKLKSEDMVRFSKAGPEQRMEMLRGNAAVRQAMLGDNAVMMQMLPGGAGPAAQLAEDQRKDLAGRVGSQLLESQAGSRAASAQLTEERRDKQSQEFWSTQAGYASSMNSTLKSAGMTDPYGYGYASRTIYANSFRAATLMGQDPEKAAIEQLQGASSDISIGKEGREYIQRQIQILERIEANQRKASNLNAHVE